MLEAYRDRFKYILVDEYQDTNAVQYDWLKLLAEPRRNLCCVGDDDQSIYSWRGAEVANILRFEKDFPGAKVIRLEQNYRSTPHILAAATGLIAHNAGRLGKTLWTEVDDGDPVKVIGVWDGPEEARRVGEEIEAHERRGGSLDDSAILVRAQFQTREFEERFIAIGLAYQIVGGFRFYERAEIRDALAYLRLVAQPADDLAFERIVNQPKRGLGDKAVATIHATPARPGSRCCSPPRRCSTATSCSPAPAAASAASSPTSPAGGRWPASCPHPELARILLDESGYTAMLQAERSAEAAGRLENLAELTRAMEEYESLGAFLEHVSLVMDNDAAASRREGHHHDHPRRQGPGIPDRLPRRLGGRRVPVAARARRRRPRQPRGGAPPGLCRDHPRAARRRPSSTPPTAASTASGPAASRRASSPSCPRTISRKRPR